MSSEHAALSERIDNILNAVMEIASGNLAARCEQSDRGDTLDALGCGINMLAEEVASRFEETRRLSAELVTEKERTIAAQKSMLLELSTPVLRIQDQVLALPLVGTLDSARATQMNEQLLTAVTDHQARVVIVDITGVPLVDSGVALNLVKSFRAVRLLGAHCILTGVKPNVAETIVKLGINLTDVTTRSTLQSGLELATELTRPPGRSPDQSGAPTPKQHATGDL